MEGMIFDRLLTQPHLFDPKKQTPECRWTLWLDLRGKDPFRQEAVDSWRASPASIPSNEQCRGIAAPPAGQRQSLLLGRLCLKCGDTPPTAL